MMGNRFEIYLVLSHGMAAIWMLAYLGGLWLCVFHRRLSPWLLLAAFGFAGLIASAAMGRLMSLASTFQDWVAITSIMASVLGCLSGVVLVFGLGLALSEIRRKLSRALDPDHARR